MEEIQACLDSFFLDEMNASTLDKQVERKLVTMSAGWEVIGYGIVGMAQKKESDTFLHTQVATNVIIEATKPEHDR